MITAMDNVTLKLPYGVELEADLELNGLWLEAVTVNNERITGNTVAAYDDPMGKVIWAAAVGWTDANSMLIEESEYEQSLARKEIHFERQREYAA